MVEIGMRVVGNSAVLDFGSVALQTQSIEERLRQVLPVLKYLVEADVAKMGLDDETLLKRFRGMAAQDMIVDASLSMTSSQAALLVEIVSGRESIADHGFPEFSEE